MNPSEFSPVTPSNSSNELGASPSAGESTVVGSCPIVSDEMGRDLGTTPVHNHGSEDGPGLACRERCVGGRLVGECVSPVSAPSEGPAPEVGAVLADALGADRVVLGDALARVEDQGPLSLWVDDSKPAPHGCAVARTYDDALRMLRRFDYQTLYLDHDLGEARTGYDLLCVLIEEGRVPPRVECISWNPVGRQRIEAALRSCPSHAEGVTKAPNADSTPLSPRGE